MNEQYIGTIIPWASSRIPQNCIVCNGQLLSIVENEVLYSILGTAYGGDGRVNFGIPDLRNRTTVGMGPNYPLGHMDGKQFVTLTKSQMPAHTHKVNFIPNSQYESTLTATAKAGTAGTHSNNPEDNFWGKTPDILFQQVNQYSSVSGETMGSNAVNVLLGGNNQEIEIDFTGGGAPHVNTPPFLVINWLIVTKGLYPQRS